MDNKKERIDLAEFLPRKIVCNEGNGPTANLKFKQDDEFIYLCYRVQQYNTAQREHSFTIPRFIFKNQETFEVLGLLQAEMSKTHNGAIVFTNSEPKIINLVLNWFEKEFSILKNNWKWYIAININENIDGFYKKKIENKLVYYWTDKTPLNLEKANPKKISYRHVSHIRLKEDYYGCLIISIKNNLFSQIFKNFLRLITYNLLKEEINHIRGFMKGILAGESCIESDKRYKKYRVHLTASNEEERLIYYKCLKILGIDVKKYENYKDLIISKRENLVQLLKQRLMTLHPRKYAKFLNMMKQYPGISQETGYFSDMRKVWNKTPQGKIDEIVELYKAGITRTKDIADKVGASQIKVQRVLKENNMGIRRIKLPEEKREEIAKFAQENPKLTQKQLAEVFNVHESVITRVFVKYKIKNKSRFKIPEEKIRKIIQMYKDNPVVKYSEIVEKIGVSSTVIKRVRREHNLEHLGYQRLVGCNNPNKDKMFSKILARAKRN